MNARTLMALAAVLSVQLIAQAETLTISTSSYEADPSKSYSAVEVTCDSTIGGTLNLDDGATVSVSAGTANFTCTVRLGASAAGAVTIAPASGTTANFTGKLTGPSAVEINGAGKTYFTSDTSDFDGNLTITKGEFHAKGKQPFGSTAGYTYFKGMGDLTRVICFDGVTTAEDLRISMGVNVYGNKNVRFTASCTFNGPFTATAAVWEWWVLTSGITVTFNGPMSGYSALLGDDYGGNPHVIFNCSAGIGTVYWKNGTLDFNRPLALAQTSDCDHFHIRGGTTYNLNCANVFGDATYCSRIKWENANASRSTMNIASNDQYFAYFLNGQHSSSATKISSTRAVTFHLMSDAAKFGTGGQEFKGVFEGYVGLSVEGAKPLALYGASTTVGALSLANGAQVTLASGSKWVGGISLAHDDGSETLTLDGGDLSVPDLWIGGERVAGGTYGSSSSAADHKLACFAGTGVITVPNARLEISGDYEVPAEGVTCSGVTVTGEATVTGGMITVDEDGLFEINANAAFECPICLGATTARQVRLVADRNVEAIFSGVVSGLSDIEIIAADVTGSVTFSGANTFDGNLTITRGSFHAVGDGAFGSTKGYTTMTSGSTLDRRIYFEGFETSEDIRLSQGGAYGVDCVRFAKSCTFNGPFTGTKVKSEWWWFGSGVKVVFNGPFSGFGDILGGDRGNWPEVTWAGSMSCEKHFWQWGTVNHCSPISFTQFNNHDNLRVRGGGTYNLYCADVFGDANYSARMQWEDANALSRTTVFNVVSNDQHFAYFHNGKWSKGTMFASQDPDVTIHLESGTGYSEAPSFQEFNGVFAGTAGLSVEGPLPLTLGGANTSSGMLSLSNGAQVTIAETGVWAGPIAVANGDGTAERLTLTSILAVEAFYTNGVRLAGGKYGAAGSSEPNTLPFLSGSGAIYVQPPMLTVDSDYVVAPGGETYCGVTVNGAARISGGRLTLCGEAPITVNADATFACDILLDTVQSSISPASGATVRFEGAISGPADIAIRAEDLTGIVWFSGANTFDGKLTIEKGEFHGDGDGAFGSAVGSTRFVGAGVPSSNVLYNRLYFHDVTSAENFELSQGFGNAWWNANVIFFEGRNVFNGTVSAAASVTEFGWVFVPGSETVFNGELTDFGYLFGQSESSGLRPYENAKVTFNAPVSMSDAWYGAYATYDYNSTVTCYSFNPRGGTHNLNIPDVFGIGKTLKFEFDRAMQMNLVGGDQHFAALTAGDKSAQGNISSEAGHTLHLAATKATDYRGIFSGDVNVSVEGTEQTVFSGASTSVGTLTATNGANVTLAADAKWAGDVDIAAGSKVTLQGAALAKKKDIRIQGDGRIVAEAGVAVRVGYVYVDGLKVPGGWYGADSGDERFRSHFPGEGRVHVAGEGMVLVVE